MFISETGTGAPDAESYASMLQQTRAASAWA